MKAFQAFQLANALRSLGVAALASRETGPWSVRVTTPAGPRIVSDVGEAAKLVAFTAANLKPKPVPDEPRNSTLPPTPRRAPR